VPGASASAFDGTTVFGIGIAQRPCAAQVETISRHTGAATEPP